MPQPDQPTELPGDGLTESELDTEGHSLSNAEFLNSTMRDRKREDAQLSRDAGHRRELKRSENSLRRRLFRR